MLISKASKCLVCGLVVHKICDKLKGIKNIPCKQITRSEEPEKRDKHQWAQRRLEEHRTCSVCSQVCNNLAHYHNYTCLWCDKVRHTFCDE